MSNTIKLKRSSTAGATPTAGSLEYGELALNYTDGNLFFKTAANVVTLLASTRIANYSGNVNAGNLSTSGSLNVTGNATVGNIGATNVVATNISGTLTTASQTNITSLGTLGSLSVTGNVSTGNVLGTLGDFTNVAGTLTTAVQTNITSVGSLTALTVTGNASVGNISTTGKVTATGNVAGSYFIGDGSLLTNLPAQAGNAITNGTSNVAITSASGNVTVGINGTANTVIISPGSIFVNGVFATPKTITSNVQVAADSSAMVISPLTIGNGYSMSIPTSSTVYVWIPS
jgi:hypothetical protein